MHHLSDLLDDRTAEVLASWPHRRRGVEIIVRDRAAAYAEGDKQRVPNAIQVADGFHLTSTPAPRRMRSCAAAARTSKRLASRSLFGAMTTTDGVGINAQQNQAGGGSAPQLRSAR